MMRSLLLGAFATSAFGLNVPADNHCRADASQIACNGLKEDNDFNILNKAGDSSTIQMTGKTLVNQAVAYIGGDPWNRELDTHTDYNGALTGANAHTDDGCIFYDRSANGASGSAKALSAAGSTAHYTCQVGTGGVTQGKCVSGGPFDYTEPFAIEVSIDDFVNKLDDAGYYTLYFHRVLENPINGDNILLEWIAENACKLKIDVSFECTGSDCVQVTTIVCASFAGINGDNTGTVAIECKVPVGFEIKASTTAATNTAEIKEYDPDGNLGGHKNGIQSAAVWYPTTGAAAVTDAGLVGNGFSCTSFTGNSVCRTNLVTAAKLGQGDVFTGFLRVSAHVRQDSQEWTTQPENLHEARYNLSRASDIAKTFSMDVNVLFYSDEKTAINANIPGLFGDHETKRPFLAKTEIKYGAITQHVHAYLMVLAKVDAQDDGTGNRPKFHDLKLTSVVHTPSDPANGALAPVPVTKTGTDVDNMCVQAGATDYYPSGTEHWPRAHLKCEHFMKQSDSTLADKLDADVKAGDTLVISLSWKILGTTQATNTGKAQLLQDAADEAQSVEVSLTIQLGGGETTITTAGGSDGSADPTVTYIIIAVCIVAAGLILAVVVVAFMCLKNRSQEQMVSMSPQKCTVAAVYDISQPKKADAMDV